MNAPTFVVFQLINSQNNNEFSNILFAL